MFATNSPRRPDQTPPQGRARTALTRRAPGAAEGDVTEPASRPAPPTPGQHYSWGDPVPVASGRRPLSPQTQTPFVHAVAVGGRRLVLDLLSGEGHVAVVAPGARLSAVGPRLYASEERLLLLDWTRRLMPVPSVQPLWDVEAAALASAVAWPEWGQRTRPGLAAALAELMRRQDMLSDLAERLVRRAWKALDEDAVPAEALAPLVEELRGTLPRRTASDPALPGSDPSPRGQGELEWDRHPGYILNPREDAVRSGLFPTVWAASVPGHRALGGDSTTPLWARLVDVSSGLIHDEVTMWPRGAGFVARGFIPAPARGTRLRVDVTSLRNLPSRDGPARAVVLAEQAWFRALLVGRRAAAQQAWRPAADAQRLRAEARVQAALAPVQPGVGGSSTGVRLPTTLAETPPFLAETALRLEQLTSG